jgi:hypothetical protein
VNVKVAGAEYQLLALVVPLSVSVVIGPEYGVMVTDGEPLVSCPIPEKTAVAVT